MKVWLFEKTKRSYVIVLGIAIIALSLFVLSFSGASSHIASAAQQILFQDGYSSSTGWTQVGTQITVNSIAHPGVVYFDNVNGGGGVTQERVYKQISLPLPSGNWTADFDYKFTASSIPNHRVFALTTTSGDPEAQAPANRIIVDHGFSTDGLFILVNGGVDSTPIPISPNVQYYVRLDKTPTLLTLSVFSDPARTIPVLGSPSTFVILPTDFNNNLNFVQHSGCTICGGARTLTAQIDNTIIYTQTAVCSTDEQGENEDQGETAAQEIQEDQGEQGEQNEQGNEDCNVQ